jgi:hypothetical protein
LQEDEARAERRRGTGIVKFDGTTLWAVFRRQFDTVVEHNCWTYLEKSTYLITAWQSWATDVLHGVPKGATYDETLEALEDRFKEKHRPVMYRCRLKPRIQDVG